MTHYEKVTREEIARRNYSEGTTRAYLRALHDLACYFHCPPERLTPEQIRHYSAHLISDRKLSGNTVNQMVGALRFFYLTVLNKPWRGHELPYPRDPRHLGAEIGFFSVLHTWNQKLLHHPHVHCIVPAGGLSPDHTLWIVPPPGFFLPVRVLSRVFRGKFVAGLRALHAAGKLGFHGSLGGLAAPAAFAAMLRTLFRDDWVVYAKRPFGGAEHALRYLGCYTHRVAISNHRLVALEGGEVVFRWRDSAHKNKKRLMRLALDEFLRRFFLHVLPTGFVRIRHFGFLAHRRRAALLPLCFALLGSHTEAEPATGMPMPAIPRPLWACPRCGGPMAIVERFTASEARWRAPPPPRQPL